MKQITILFFTLLMFAANSAFAASSVLIWPLTQTIPADEKGSVLWLENRGAAPVTLQIRIVSWQQQQFQERYGAQQNVVASPPFATVAPGDRQMIRVIALKPAPSGQELAYRVIVDEVPSANSADAGSGIKFQMRYLLPLFVAGQGVLLPNAERGPEEGKTYTQPLLNWRYENQDGKKWLVVKNQGVVHARLSSVFWGSSPKSQNAALMLNSGLLGYVLPGQEMRWPLPAGRPIPPGKLYANLQDNMPPIIIPSAG